MHTSTFLRELGIPLHFANGCTCSLSCSAETLMLMTISQSAFPRRLRLFFQPLIASVGFLATSTPFISPLLRISWLSHSAYGRVIEIDKRSLHLKGEGCRREGKSSGKMKRGTERFYHHTQIDEYLSCKLHGCIIIASITLSNIVEDCQRVLQKI